MMLAASVLITLGTALGAAGAHTPPIVPGRAFDRFIYIILENQDFTNVDHDAHWNEIAPDGIILENFFALTHPSQPNYIATLAGDYFGLNHDEVINIPQNVSTVVDLLENRNVSWGAYMEDIPSPGYMGAYSDGSSGTGWDYVRKHNPFVSFDSISHHGERLLKINGFLEFGVDFLNKELPQWIFITPNMIHDGHNSTLSTATSWTHDFVKPLLADDAFDERTLILITYDESEDYGKPNRIGGLLLGNAIPSELKGHRDKTFYNHYSVLSTIEFNWRLPNLGRYDVGANIFQWVEDFAKDSIFQNKDPPNADTIDYSESYSGFLHNHTEKQIPWPLPNLGLTGAGGEPILDSIRLLFRYDSENTPYDGSGELFDAKHPPVYKPQPQL